MRKVSKGRSDNKEDVTKKKNKKKKERVTE
jgi:hypothetical protein